MKHFDKAWKLMQEWRTCGTPTCTTCPVKVTQQRLADALREAFELGVKSAERSTEATRDKDPS